MKVHNSELVEALVDNQLSGLRRWSVQRHVSRCPSCALTYRQHLRVRQMLQANPVNHEMDDSAEFFWSKVKSDVESQARPRRAFWSRGSATESSERSWMPVLIPSLALASIVVIGGIFWLKYDAKRERSAPSTEFVQTRPAPVAVRVNNEILVPRPKFAHVESADTDVPDAVVTSFESEEAGVTVIWVSGLPWTKDMNELQTVLASL